MLKRSVNLIKVSYHRLAPYTTSIMVKTRQSTRVTVTNVNQTVQPTASPSVSEPPNKRRKTGHRPTQVSQEEETSTEKTLPPKRKIKTQNIDSSEFLPRADSHWKVGAHVSAAGGVENAVVNAASIGANSFALFLKSQRKWESPALTDDSIREFKRRMKEHGYGNRMVLPHGSYLINLGNPNAEKREKSYACFLDDLKRCEALDLELYNFHPGSTVGDTTVENSLSLIADCINRAHRETQRVTVVLENMAGAGNIIGSDFAHLAGIIKLVQDQERVGVCLDTCHAFAAGYDIRTEEGWNATLAQFDEQVGLKYLCGMHLNDSKTTFNSKKDRHENIGLGHLGIESFRHILRDPRTQNIPLILETPSFEQAKEVWGTEIAVLQRMSSAFWDESATCTANYDVFMEEIKSAVKSSESTKGGQKSKATRAVKDKGTSAAAKRNILINEENGGD